MDAPQAVTAERATVIGIDPSRGGAYRVRTISGRVFVCAQIKASPNDNTLLPMQTQVVVDYRFGAPYINGILPSEYAEVHEDNPANITDTDGHGGEDPAYQRNLRIGARAQGDPQDIMPGDAVLTSPDNSAVGALVGKVAVVRGSPMAQLRALGQQNLVHLMSGIFRHDTWMGTSEVINESGKTSYRFRGGSDQLNETGPDAEKFTIHLDVGDTGDVIDLRVTNLEGETLFRFHVTADGALDVYARGGVRQLGGSRGAQHPHQYVGQHAVEVDGAHSLIVSGPHETSADSARHQIDNSRTTMVGLDDAKYVNRDESANVGGNSRREIAGSATQISSGNFDIRSTSGEGLISTKERLSMATDGPAVILAQSLRVNTPRGDSIELGDNALLHAVMYEPLDAALQLLVQDYLQFKQAVIAHVHPIPNPATTGTAPSLIPLGATAFILNLSAARSQWVRLK